MAGSLAGKVAPITGGATGMGGAAARLCSRPRAQGSAFSTATAPPPG